VFSENRKRGYFVENKEISQGSDVVKQFQLTTEGIGDKSSPEFGTAISKYIWGTAAGSVQSYYFTRNARFFKNRNYANGKIDVKKMFQDRFQFNGKQNYISLNWNTLQIVNRIVSGLVGRWVQRNEKIQVSAIDTLSVKEKKDQYEQVEFILNNRAQLEKLQQESGVQLIPEDQFIPEDKDELKLWQAQFQRLPEEILYEMGCNDVLASNGYFDVMKEKLLHDAAEVLFVGTYTWMDSDGVIHIRWVKPEDAIYSYSEYPDFRDTTWRGEAPSMKISEIRRMYGVEFGGKLTEKDIYEKICPHAKEYQKSNNLSWDDTWWNAYMRPYDEWNVTSLQFEFKTVDSEPYTVTKTKSNGRTYTQKGYPTTSSGKRRDKPSDNQKVLNDTHWNIYRGVYLPDCDVLLEWGLKKNMIRPQDPKEIGNAEFSYSFFMPQTYQMRNMAIPEKIEAAVDGMILALLKMQQVVARMRPTGAAVNTDALQNIDYGLGDAGNQGIDAKKLFDQTGDVYYKGRDAEGNPIPIPIQELANTGFIHQMNGLIANYQFNYQILKDELGEDPNLMSQALQPRVTAGNVQASQLQAEFATDYIYSAFRECMKITSRKVSCLLKDSVTYGATAYRGIVGKDDVEGRQFTTEIKMLPTLEEQMRFEMVLNQAMVSTPDLVLFISPFELLRIAKEDIKLAELLYRNGQKKMLLHQQQVAMTNQQQTIEGQIAAAQAAEQAKQQTESLKGDISIKEKEVTAKAQNQSAVVNLVASLLTPQTNAEGVTSSPKIPAELQPMVTAVLENILVTASVNTEEQKQKVIDEMRAAQAQAAEQQMQQQNVNNQPPQEVAA
jgi:hypothetical protein